MYREFDFLSLFVIEKKEQRKEWYKPKKKKTEMRYNLV